mgnify:CR=1 FL=1
MVYNVGLDDAVKQVTTYEPEVTVYGRAGAPLKRPLALIVAKKAWVGVLEGRNRDCLH